MGQSCCSHPLVSVHEIHESKAEQHFQVPHALVNFHSEQLLKTIFEDIDADANGKVDVKELNMALRQSADLQKLFNVSYGRSKGNGKGSAPPPPSFFLQLIEKLDTDGDGKISYSEFVNYFLPCVEGREDSSKSWLALNNVFDGIDTDHNGQITIKELNIALQGSPEIQTLLNVTYNQPPKGKGKGSAPPLPTFFHKLIKEFDVDGDSQISRAEFLAHFRDVL